MYCQQSLSNQIKNLFDFFYLGFSSKNFHNLKCFLPKWTPNFLDMFFCAIDKLIIVW